jgi:hypothetical protein
MDPVSQIAISDILAPISDLTVQQPLTSIANRPRSSKRRASFRRLAGCRVAGRRLALLRSWLHDAGKREPWSLVRTVQTLDDCRVRLARTLAGSAGMAAAIYGAWVRTRLMRWGASEQEVSGPYPGAELVPHGQRGPTMAVTINAPPDQVWPWLVQLGGAAAVGTPGTTSITPVDQVHEKSTLSGKTSPLATR